MKLFALALLCAGTVQAADYQFGLQTYAPWIEDPLPDLLGEFSIDVVPTGTVIVRAPELTRLAFFVDASHPEGLYNLNSQPVGDLPGASIKFVDGVPVDVFFNLRVTGAPGDIDMQDGWFCVGNGWAMLESSQQWQVHDIRLAGTAQIAAVPEPSTWLLLALGLTALGRLSPGFARSRRERCTAR